MELWDIYDRQRRTTGRFHVRGTPMGRGEYHLTAFVWVFNRQRELLLTRRAPEKEHYANCWAASPARQRRPAGCPRPVWRLWLPPARSLSRMSAACASCGTNSEKFGMPETDGPQAFLPM